MQVLVSAVLAESLQQHLRGRRQRRQVLERVDGDEGPFPAHLDQHALRGIDELSRNRLPW